MKQQTEYSLSIGLNRPNNSPLTPEEGLKVVCAELTQAGIIGFSVGLNTGYWQGQPEQSLNVTFINTFSGVTLRKIKQVVEYLRVIMGQDSILLSRRPVSFEFVEVKK